MGGKMNVIGIVIHCSNPNESNNSSRVGYVDVNVELLEFDI